LAPTVTGFSAPAVTGFLALTVTGFLALIVTGFLVLITALRILRFATGGSSAMDDSTSKNSKYFNKN
jgi:hypothetical protein